MSNEEILELDSQFEANKNDELTVSKIAMTLSMKTSVYDRTKGYHEKMPALLAKIAKTGFMDARWAVAKNPHTDVETLEMLALDEVNLVRALVATNPKTPIKILERLFSDEKIVRDGLSGNPSTPEKLLKILSDDSDKMVRLRVADNPSTTPEILTSLLSDVEPNVIKAAEVNLRRAHG